MYKSFYGCANVVANYDDEPITGNILNFGSCFAVASSFHASLAGWDVSNATDLGYMFIAADINETGTTTNYDATLISWAAQTVNPNLTPHFGNSKYGAGQVDSGTTDGTTASKLIQSGQNFNTTVTIGDVVHNTTDDTYARVTAVDSDTQLSLDTDIMISGENYVIQGSDAAKARASLILDDNWEITDGGQL